MVLPRIVPSAVITFIEERVLMKMSRKAVYIFLTCCKSVEGKKSLAQEVRQKSDISKCRSGLKRVGLLCDLYGVISHQK